MKAIGHLLCGAWHLRRLVGAAEERRIADAVHAAEQGHVGEIRVVVESALGVGDLIRGVTPRERALLIFAIERIWDTERNTGVLLYVLVGARDVEIVSDRGLNAGVPRERWEAVCRAIEGLLAGDRFVDGIITGVRMIGEILREAVPDGQANISELENRPIVR